TGNQAYPSVCTDDTGGFVIVWSDLAGADGDSAGVFARRFDATGAARGSELQVNSYTTGPQDAGRVACAPNGDFVVAWSGPGTGDDDGVFVRRFTSSGTPVGTELLVNTYTTGGQLTPSVAVDASGRFVVAWWDYDQDGDNAGVFGRRFDAAGA